MNPDSHALPLVEDESRGDLKVNQQKISSPTSNLGSKLVQPQPDSKTTDQLMLPTTKEGAILAIPLSYCFPTEPDNSTPEEKKASPSVKSISKKEAKFDREFSANWKCERTQRKCGKREKFYYHIETGFKCRSLLEVERYEKNGGIIPRRKPKEMKTENTEEIVKEIGAIETEEASAAKNLRETLEGKRVVDENFMEDTHINQNQSCHNEDYLSDDSERTPSPPWSRTGIIPRFAPNI